MHDVLNVFMCTGFTRDTHQYFMKASPVRPGDFIEFFAEIDLLGALSACPGGDCSAHAFERCGEVLAAESGGVEAEGGGVGGVEGDGAERVWEGAWGGIARGLLAPKSPRCASYGRPVSSSMIATFMPLGELSE